MCSSKQHLWSVILKLVAKSLLSTLLVWPSRKKKCVVSWFVCRFSVGARTSKTGVCSRIPAWQCSPSLVAIANSIMSSPINALWSLVGTACAGQVMSCEWSACVLRSGYLASFCSAKDTSERWYHGGIPRSETASRPGVRISDFVEEGRVEYVPVALPVLGPPGPSKIRSFFSKQKRKISRSPVELPQKIEISSPPASSQKQSLLYDPSFALALTAQTSCGKCRWSGWDRRAAPVIRMGFP